MSYVPFNSEEDNKLAQSIMSTQLMMGVFPSEKYVKKVKNKYTDPKESNFTNKILIQDKNLIAATNSNFEKCKILNTQMDDAILQVGNKLDLIESSLISNNQSDIKYTKELDIKENEFKTETDKNEEKAKNIKDNIPELVRKKKENEEFFKKYEGEKKVWLDRLKENNIQKETYKTGFKYLYEAKIVKLILEGILLEKVQDMVEKEMCKRGELLGWNIMNEIELENEKKEDEFEFHQRLLRLETKDQLIQEKEHNKRKEQLDEKEESKRKEIREEWKSIWRQIWIPEENISLDSDIISKRNLMIQATMDVTFKLFQKMFYDIYKLKNIILSNDEYVILDKIKNYFPEKNIIGRTQEEIALNQLMNIIDNIKAEEEIIYCDLTMAKKKLEEYSKSTEKHTTAIINLKLIIDKIEEVQDRVNKKGSELIKSDVEQIRKLINKLPYENEKKLFFNNLKNSERLFDTFLPLNNILMVVTFMTVGKKREKNYENKIEESKNEVMKIKGKNNEISGKWDLIKELKEKFGDEDANDILEKSQEIGDDEEFKCKKIIEDIKKSLNKIIELKNKQQMNSFDFYKKLRKVIVRPKDLC